MSTDGTRLTRGQGWVLALTSAASLMVSLDTQVVATALPVIRPHLHASLAEPASVQNHAPKIESRS